MRLSEIHIPSWAITVLNEIQRRPGRAALIALNAIPAIEMALRSVGNIYRMSPSEKQGDLHHELGGNLIGVILFTTCAFDRFTGARLCGAIGFIVYSTYYDERRHAPLSSKFIYTLYNNVVPSAITRITGLVSAFFKSISIRMIALVVIVVGGYLLYGGTSQKIDTLYFRETASKTWAMFSKVWR